MQCKEIRANFNQLVSEHEGQKQRVVSLEKMVKLLKSEIAKLECVKSGAIGEIAVAKAEVAIIIVIANGVIV